MTDKFAEKGAISFVHNIARNLNKRQVFNLHVASMENVAHSQTQTHTSTYIFTPIYRSSIDIRYNIVRRRGGMS